VQPLKLLPSQSIRGPVVRLCCCACPVSLPVSGFAPQDRTMQKYEYYLLATWNVRHLFTMHVCVFISYVSRPVAGMCLGEALWRGCGSICTLFFLSKRRHDEEARREQACTQHVSHNKPVRKLAYKLFGRSIHSEFLTHMSILT
jgi:hypothetical protein